MSDRNVIGDHGDWAFPNPDGTYLLGYRRTADIMDNLVEYRDEALFGSKGGGKVGGYRAYLKGPLVKIWR